MKALLTIYNALYTFFFGERVFVITKKSLAKFNSEVEASYEAEKLRQKQKEEDEEERKLAEAERILEGKRKYVKTLHKVTPKQEAIIKSFDGKVLISTDNESPNKRERLAFVSFNYEFKTFEDVRYLTGHTQVTSTQIKNGEPEAPMHWISNGSLKNAQELIEYLTACREEFLKVERVQEYMDTKEKELLIEDANR